MKFSKKATGISPSLTLGIDTLAKEMKAQGKDVISFGVGEPDFDTPQYIKEAAKAAIDRGCTKYTPVPGIMELRQAISDRYKEVYGLEYGAAGVVVSNGAKQSLYNTFQAILDPGDEVIIIAPYWVTYPELVKMASGKPVIVEARRTTSSRALRRLPRRSRRIRGRSSSTIPPTPAAMSIRVTHLRPLPSWQGSTTSSSFRTRFTMCSAMRAR